MVRDCQDCPSIGPPWTLAEVEILDAEVRARGLASALARLRAEHFERSVTAAYTKAVKRGLLRLNGSKSSV